jgi:hypothetical protein
MTFINLSILFGLGAISIPVIIHLFNRRKAKVIEWGAMKFLLGSLISRKRRVLVEEIILMALRCLLVAALVLAVSRPFSPVQPGISWLVLLPLVLGATILLATTAIMARDRRWQWALYASVALLVVSLVTISQWEEVAQSENWKSVGKQDVAIVIDGSSSMRLMVEGKSNFQRAVDEARLVIQALGPDDAVTIVVAGGRTDVKTPNPVNLRGNIGEVLDGLQPHDGPMSVLEAFEKAGTSLARGDNAAKKVVLITDGQNVGWETAKPERWQYVAKALGELPTKPRVITRFLRLPKTYRNIAVSSLALSRTVVGTDRNVSVDVQVENTGRETAAPDGVQLRFQDGTVISKPLDPIEPGQSQHVRFSHQFAQNGTQVLTARVTYNDDLIDDNQQSLVVQVLATLPVLLVDGSAQVREEDRSTFFLEMALAPPPEEELTEEESPLGRQLVTVRVVAAPDLDERVHFEDYRVVMLVDVPRLGAEAAKRLASYVSHGGGLLIAPGERSEAAFYNGWQLPDGQPVMPAELVQRVNVPDDAGGLGPALDQCNHSAFTRVIANEETDLGTALVSAYWQLKVDPSDAGVTTGALLDGGHPLLVERVASDGLVALSSISLDDNGHNLVTLNSFLPLVHELTYHLAARDMVQLNHSPAEILTLDFPLLPAGTTDQPPSKESQRQSVDVRHPSGDLVDQAAVEIRERRMLVTVVGAEKPGVYALQLPAQLGDSLADLVVKQSDESSGVPFAVELALDESYLEGLSASQEAVAQEHFKEFNYFRAGDAEQMVAAVSGNIPGHELWKYLAVAALTILLVECFVTRWVAMRRKTDTMPQVAFVSEGEKMSSFRDRAREMVAQVRAK